MKTLIVFAILSIATAAFCGDYLQPRLNATGPDGTVTQWDVDEYNAAVDNYNFLLETQRETEERINEWDLQQQKEEERWEKHRRRMIEILQ